MGEGRLSEGKTSAGIQADVHRAANIERLAGIDAVGAALAHELNQPLTALLVYLQVLERSDCAREAGLRELVAKVRAEGERAMDIVRRMKRLSLKAAPDKTEVDLADLAEEAIEAAMIAAVNIPQVERDYAMEAPRVRCDPVQIRQVMVNLLRNAIEATARVGNPRISVAVKADDSHVWFVVADNGPGIGPTFEKRLFRAFETTKTEGQGLGLAISRMISQNHGGDLVLLSKAGDRGATFAVKLPLG